MVISLDLLASKFSIKRRDVYLIHFANDESIKSRGFSRQITKPVRDATIVVHTVIVQ